MEQISCAKTRQQLASEYGVCWKTFNKWLKRNNIELNRGLITPNDQKKIYKKIGIPVQFKKV